MKSLSNDELLYIKKQVLTLLKIRELEGELQRYGNISYLNDYYSKRKICGEIKRIKERLKQLKDSLVNPPKLE
jgi:chromosome segregation ATPase